MPSPVHISILNLPQTQGETVEGGILRVLFEVRTQPANGEAQVSIDVSTVASVLDGDGNLTHPALVHDAAGRYHLDLALTAKGQWKVRVVASGEGEGAAESGFWVADSAFT